MTVWTVLTVKFPYASFAESDISVYTGSGGDVACLVFFETWYLCNRHPIKIPTMQLKAETSKCEMIIDGTKGSVVPVWEKYTITIRDHSYSYATCLLKPCC